MSAERGSQPATAFGPLLRRYCAAAGLTQEELAARARLSVRAISDLERGLKRPRRDNQSGSQTHWWCHHASVRC